MNITNLLDPEQIEALARVKASLSDEPAKLGDACGAVRCKAECAGFVPSGVKQDGFELCTCTHTKQSHTARERAEEPVRLVDAPVTTINGVEVDLRSEGLYDTECTDCQHPLQVEIAPRVPPRLAERGMTQAAWLDYLTSKPRAVRCVPCGQAYVRNKKGSVVYDARDFKPAEGSRHHQRCKCQECVAPATPEPKKEQPVIDLTEFSEPELAALAIEARKRMVAEKAESLPAKREAALQADAERVEVDQARLVANREARRGQVLPAFEFKGKYVPALDLTEVTDTAEVVNAKLRSPYNKVLYAAQRDLLDSETTTYRDIQRVHQEFVALFGAGEPKKAKKAKKKEEEPSLVAVIDPEAKAKIEAFAKVTGLSKKKARKRLTSMGVI